MADIPSSGSSPTSGGANAGSGLDPNVAAVLTYLCIPITSIVFLLVEKSNKHVRFHAWHSLFFFAFAIVFSIAFTIVSVILSYIPFLGVVVGILSLLIYWVGFPILWIVMMVKAYQGSRFTIPIVTDFAQKQVDKEA